MSEVKQNFTILGIGSAKELFTRDTSNSKWEHVPNSGSAIGVTVLPGGKIVGIGADNRVLYQE